MNIRTRGERQASKIVQYDSRGKKPWTAEEDNLLKEITDKHGTGNWTFIAQHFTERSGKQCRERWHNHLNPVIKKGEWTAEEDEIIITMQRQWGNQWAKITTLLPGRTDNAVKNRFHATLRATKGKKGKMSSSYIDDGEMEVDMDMEMDDEMEELKDDSSELQTSEHTLLKPAASQPKAYPAAPDHEDLDIADESSRFNSIGSIDMTTWKSSTGFDIDINGLRDWVVDSNNEMDIDASDAMPTTSSNAPQPYNTQANKVPIQAPKSSWLPGGFTTTMCSGNDYESDDRKGQAHQKSSLAFCSLSYSYLQGRF